MAHLLRIYSDPVKLKQTGQDDQPLIDRTRVIALR
jgi:hypothetical protein